MGVPGGGMVHIHDQDPDYYVFAPPLCPARVSSRNERLASQNGNPVSGYLRIEFLQPGKTDAFNEGPSRVC
jgi:hypothetical protein